MTKRIDPLLLAFLLAWPLCAASIAVISGVSFLVSIAVFFGPVFAILALRVPRAFPRAFLFAIVISLGVTATVDIVAHASRAWVADTVFQSRLLGLAPWEDFILGIALTTALLLFYEWREQHHQHFPIRRAQWVRFGAFVGVLVLFVLMVWIFDASLLSTPHPFLKLGLAAVVMPATLDLLRHRILTMKFIRTSMYWAYALLVYELTAMHAGWWQFPRHDYIGWISFGTLAFPFEELVFWVFGVSIAGLTFYEHFIDDHR